MPKYMQQTITQQMMINSGHMLTLKESMSLKKFYYHSILSLNILFLHEQFTFLVNGVPIKLTFAILFYLHSTFLNTRQ